MKVMLMVMEVMVVMVNLYFCQDIFPGAVALRLGPSGFMITFITSIIIFLNY